MVNMTWQKNRGRSLSGLTLNDRVLRTFRLRKNIKGAGIRISKK